jgi:hippurate hydrolase
MTVFFGVSSTLESASSFTLIGGKLMSSRPILKHLTLTMAVLALAGPHALAGSLLSEGVAATIDRHIDESVSQWIAFYKTCHSHPELSLHEEQSAARLAKVFKDAGMDVTSGVGGYGVVGVLANGKGPTLLIRGDMDALPVVEETGLPYASKATFTNSDGSKVGVMHACGHDVHQTVLAGTAKTLAAMQDEWAGTIVFIAQPAEEIGQGARLMIEDGLFKRFPRPDRCIALHVSHQLKVGTVGYTSGWAFANVDSVNVTIYGKGGHGSAPHTTVDPIATAAQVVLALQTIVSRRIDPREAGVVTVGSIHAGTKHNIIPNEAHLQLTVRSYKDEVRKTLLDSIRQITTDVAKSARCPRPPKVEILDGDFTPASYNDPELTSHALEVFKEILGADNALEQPPTMGGEDFGRFAKYLGVPGFMFWLGAVDEERFAAAQVAGGEPLPSTHSAKFRVDPEPCIRTGVRSMSALALSLLRRE